MSATNLSTNHNADTLIEVSFFTNTSQANTPVTPNNDQLQLQKKLDSLLNGIESPFIREAIRSVLTDLARLRDILRIVEMNASGGGPLPVTLALFSLIESESKSLIRFIEKRVPKIKGVKGLLRQVLDGMSFALRHELKRVFGHELGRINQGLNKNQLRGEVMRVHGLLSNCFQQSIIALAQVFDPSINAGSLFDDYRDRLEESTMLLGELSSLMNLAHEAAEARDDGAGDSLLRDLKSFSNGTMHYLMYKDWEEFEDITREVITSQGSARHGFILHCFVTYLEALINQVRMRAVLNDQTICRSSEE